MLPFSIIIAFSFAATYRVNHELYCLSLSDTRVQIHLMNDKVSNLCTMIVFQRLQHNFDYSILHCVSKKHKHVTTFSKISWTRTVCLQKMLAYLLLRLGHRQVFLVSYLTYLVHLLSRPKCHEFCLKLLIFPMLQYYDINSKTVTILFYLFIIQRVYRVAIRHRVTHTLSSCRFLCCPVGRPRSFPGTYQKQTLMNSGWTRHSRTVGCHKSSVHTVSK